MQIQTVGLNSIGYSDFILMMFFTQNGESELIIWSTFLAFSLFTLKLCQVMNRNILFKYSPCLMKKHKNLPIAKTNSA